MFLVKPKKMASLYQWIASEEVASLSNKGDSENKELDNSEKTFQHFIGVVAPMSDDENMSSIDSAQDCDLKPYQAAKV